MSGSSGEDAGAGYDILCGGSDGGRVRRVERVEGVVRDLGWDE